MNTDGGAPRHGHRTPAEIAEDEVMAMLRGETSEVAGGNGAPRETSRMRMSRNERLLPVKMSDRVQLDANRAAKKSGQRDERGKERGNREAR